LTSQAIARRYAIALADVVAKQGIGRDVHAELADWERMIASSDLLKELLQNPTIPYEQKQKALIELIARTKVRATTANFLQVLLKNQRLTELTAINQKFTQVLDERAGMISAEVTSARPVPENAKQTIQDQIRRFTGRDVRVSYAIDESLIGGLITMIGSTVYDGSNKNQLEELGERLAGN
jgi:F-type H+-transporting ATPase subunit delta